MRTPLYSLSWVRISTVSPKWVMDLYSLCTDSTGLMMPRFSISATSRAPSGQERDGVDYYFLSHGEFMQAVTENRFVEWEEVYEGTCYGTLRSEVERIWQRGHVIVFDVDVLGGINLKRIFGGDACSVFIMPPSVEELRRRLEGRGTDAPEVIERRVAKAEFELTKAPEFDHIVLNDRLEEAVERTCAILDAFIGQAE